MRKTRADERGGGSIGALAVLLVLGAVAVVGILGNRKDAEAAVDLTTLTGSSTHTTLTTAPLDADPFAATDGLVVHPRAQTALYSAPEGEPFAKIGPTQFGPTWLPVVGRSDGWVQVLLPSKPNRSTGWLRDDGLDRAASAYLIRVHTGSRTIELFQQGKSLGRWKAGVGAKKTPTPPGRTFLLGSIIDPKRSASPIVLPLGAHSPSRHVRWRTWYGRDPRLAPAGRLRSGRQRRLRAGAEEGPRPPSAGATRNPRTDRQQMSFVMQQRSADK